MDKDLDRLVEQILVLLGKSNVSSATKDAIKNGILLYKSGNKQRGLGFENFLASTDGLQKELSSETRRPETPSDGANTFYA